MPKKTIPIITLMVCLLAAAVQVSNRQSYIIFPILLLAISLVTIWVIQANRFDKRIKRSIGSSLVKPDLPTLLSELKLRDADLTMLAEHIGQIGQEKFTETIACIQDMQMKSILNKTNKSLIELRKKDIEKNWIATRTSSIAAVKHLEKEICTYGQSILSIVAKELNAGRACFYKAVYNETDSYLELCSTYAFGKYSSNKERIYSGEGLVGEVLRDKQMIHAQNVVMEYVTITSGLGEAESINLYIVPLVSGGEVYGVIEIGTLSKLLPYQLDYLEQIGGIVGYNLYSLEVSRTTQMHLENAQNFSRELKFKEQTLVANLEELNQSQKVIRQKQLEMDAILATLSTVEIDPDGKILSCNNIFLALTGYSKEDLIGKPYKTLVPKHQNDMAQFDMMWESIKSGQYFSGEFKILNKDNVEKWIAGNLTPILDDNGVVTKIMLLALFTSQDKEKMMQLQDSLNAFKLSLPVAELNADLSFKSASESFLTKLGISRIDLKRTQIQEVISSESLTELEIVYADLETQKTRNLVLEIESKTYGKIKYDTILSRISDKKTGYSGLIILKNQL